MFDMSFILLQQLDMGNCTQEYENIVEKEYRFFNKIQYVTKEHLNYDPNSKNMRIDSLDSSVDLQKLPPLHINLEEEMSYLLESQESIKLERQLTEGEKKFFEIESIQFEFPKEYDSEELLEQKPMEQLDYNITYIGQWKFFQELQKHLPHGKGIVEEKKKWKYIGYLSDGTPNKFGRFIDYQKFIIYEGQIKDKVYEGKGKLYTMGISQFEGLFHNYKKVKGKEIFENQSEYQGKYNQKEEKQDQDGFFKWKDNTTYRGSFKNDVIQGKGHMIYSNGREYIGQFVKEKKHGKGIWFLIGLFKWPNGSFYEGQYKYDLKHGYGVFKWNQNSYYQGNFFEGQMHGQGKLYTKKGNRIQEKQVYHQMGKFKKFIKN